jgi:hypothetical protein
LSTFHWRERGEKRRRKERRRIKGQEKRRI